VRIKFKYFLLGSFIALGLSIGFVAQLPDGKLHLVFCDVGQGDATYIKTKKGSDILIDGGPNEKVLSCLGRHMAFYNRDIELMVLTHPHTDHFTGLIYVLERYRVKKIVLENIYVPNNDKFEAFRQKIAEEKAEIYNLKAGDKIVVDGVELTALWPKEVIGDRNLWNITNISNMTNIQMNNQISKYSNEKAEKKECDENCQKVLGASTVSGDLNNCSLVFLLKNNDFRALLTGDADKEVLSKINELKEGNGEFDFREKPLDLLKAPHHGSKHSLSTTLLYQLKPKMAVISVGKNSFGHPASEILKILRDEDIKILRTDKNGEVEIKN